MRDFARAEAEEATQGAIFLQYFFFVKIQAKHSIDVFQVSITANEKGAIFLEDD
jgi:hypothetical protein